MRNRIVLMAALVALAACDTKTEEKPVPASPVQQGSGDELTCGPGGYVAFPLTAEARDSVGVSVFCLRPVTDSLSEGLVMDRDHLRPLLAEAVPFPGSKWIGVQLLGNRQ